MADSSVDVTPGSGASIDTRTESTNGNHRQVIVIGDESDNSGLAPVDATNGLAVDVKQMPIQQSDLSTVSSDKTGAITGVTTASTTLAAANTSRFNCYIENQTNQDIHVCLKATAVAGDRVVTLFSKGDFFNVPGWYHDGAISAIHSGSGTKNVLVVEVDE